MTYSSVTQCCINHIYNRYSHIGAFKYDQLKTTGIRTSLIIGSICIKYVHCHIYIFRFLYIILSKYIYIYIFVYSRINHTKNNPWFIETRDVLVSFETHMIKSVKSVRCFRALLRKQNHYNARMRMSSHRNEHVTFCRTHRCDQRLCDNMNRSTKYILKKYIGRVRNLTERTARFLSLFLLYSQKCD